MTFYKIGDEVKAGKFGPLEHDFWRDRGKGLRKFHHDCDQAV